MDTENIVGIVIPQFSASYQEFMTVIGGEYKKHVPGNSFGVTITQDENFSAMQRQAVRDFVVSQKMKGINADYNYSVDETVVGKLYNVNIYIIDAPQSKL
jgi:hypothetical protein